MSIIPTPIVLAIVGLGLFEVFLSILAQRKLTNPKRMRQLQNRMKVVTKEMQELGNSASKEVLLEKQNEVMKLMRENMGMMIKPMLVALPLFFILYYVILPAGFNAYAGQTFQFVVPLTYKEVFFVTVLICGLITSIIITVYDRKKMKEESLVSEQQQT